MERVWLVLGIEAHDTHVLGAYAYEISARKAIEKSDWQNRGYADIRIVWYEVLY